MYKTIQMTLVPAVLAMLIGCDGSGPSAGNVATIDLQRVAKELGRDQEIQKEMNQYWEKVTQTLQGVAKELEAKLAADRETAGEAPTDEQRAALERRRLDASRKYRSEAAEADRQRQIKQFQMIQEFRAYVSPYARQIAKKRGFTIVMIYREDLVLAVDPSADITDDVIAQMTSGVAPPVSAPSTSPTTAPGSEPSNEAGSEQP